MNEQSAPSRSMVAADTSYTEVTSQFRAVIGVIRILPLLTYLTNTKSLWCQGPHPVGPSMNARMRGHFPWRRVGCRLTSLSGGHLRPNYPTWNPRQCSDRSPGTAVLTDQMQTSFLQVTRDSNDLSVFHGQHHRASYTYIYTYKPKYLKSHNTRPMKINWGFRFTAEFFIEILLYTEISASSRRH